MALNKFIRRKVLSERHHWIISIILVIIMILITVSVYIFSNSFPIHITRLGRIRGSQLKTRLGKAIMAYKGIRYAAPEGESRFSLSKAAKPWKRVFDATDDGPICPQNSKLSSEDCLRLNVYTTLMPSEKRENKSDLKPVIAYLGGFLLNSGGSNTEKEGPEYLLDYGVILVTINYRVGVFGFLSTKKIPGNNGFKDQLLALEWIRDNIKDYGGDPNSVTLMGWSGGAISTMVHVMSNASVGLFHRAIIMSGSLPFTPTINLTTIPWHQSSEVSELSRFVGCGQRFVDENVKCLRKMSQKRLGKLSSRYADRHCPSIMWRVTNEPNFDQKKFWDQERNFFAEGIPQREIKIPILAGFVKNEFYHHAKENFDDEERLKVWRDLGMSKVLMSRCFIVNDEHGLIWSKYLRSKNGSESFEGLGEMFSDILVKYPVSYFGSQLATNETFLYKNVHVNGFSKFSHNNSTDYVIHGDDKVYILKDSSYPVPSGPETEHMEKVLALWTSFAKTGNPNDKSGGSKITKINWGKYDESNKTIFIIGNEWKNEPFEVTKVFDAFTGDKAA